MLLRFRVSLPDRPGVLGQVARAFGVLGADILQVTVLEREAGRAVDDFTVSWAGTLGVDELRERVSVVPGARVEGAWPTREVPGANPEYDLLGHIAADPERAYQTLVDAVPDLVSAEWAAALDAVSGEVAYASWAAPPAPVLGELPATRPVAVSDGPLHLIGVPIAEADLHLVVARAQGPAFHRVELDRVARLVEIVAMLARPASRTTPAQA
jgi:ACT domain.